MRHAKSSWDNPSLSDFQRPLAGRGLRDAPRMGDWLHSQKHFPDSVVSSPAQRAKQTALLVCNALGFAEDKIDWRPNIYNAELKTLLEVLSCVPPKTGLTLLIGHNPGLEFLYTFLGGGQYDGSTDSELIKTATVVLLDMPNDWTNLAPGCGSVRWIKNPKDLGASP